MKDFPKGTIEGVLVFDPRNKKNAPNPALILQEKKLIGA